MMSQGDAEMREEAAGWFLRQRDPARADWDGFVLWLEADPAHNAAYEAVALADDDLESWIVDRAPELPSNDNLPPPARARPRWFAGTAAAAAILVGGLVSYPRLNPVGATYAVETGAGRRRLVMLDDGTKIELNGGSRLGLRRGDTRFASLDRGEATFTVVHDPAAPFEVHSGDVTLRDVGTVFNVIRTGSDTEAAVAEGAVLFDPNGDAIRLGAGRMINVSATGAAVIGEVDPSTVGAWRKDRLVYQNASLARIAADLSRNVGALVTVAPELERERFSGVILLDDDHPRLFARIGALLDVDATQDGKAWHLALRKRAGR
ncbi:FecR family protein [Rhizorhabdus argentea]|uniref:FecR family protein n=1 Tax=Rhizorhabdus argentea TaxID=1387174 RepID=UPI0030EF32EC